MTFHLFIRDDIVPDKFVKHSSHSTYKLAGEAGQKASGNAGWYVKPYQNYVPSREEQLLQEVTPKITKHQLSVQLAMED